MLIGATVFGWIVGSIVPLVVGRNDEENALKNTMQNVSKFARENHLPVELLHQMKMHCREMCEATEDFDEAEILNTLPSTLRVEVIKHRIQKVI
jgi:hypothetical protein